MTADRAMTPDQFREYDRVNRLRPKESDFIGKPGYKRTENPDGTYSWRYRYKPNAGENRPTKESSEVWERLKPFVAADTERKLKGPRKPKAALRDADGGVRYVDPALADKAAQRNGWTHFWRAGGNRIERGIDGMLFREGPNGWEPTGRWCMTRPHAWAERPSSSCRADGTFRADGETYGPDGRMWVYSAGRWIGEGSL